MERVDSFDLWDFSGKGEYTDNKFLMSTPFPIAVILVSYLWFVLKFGPEYMKKRKPFHLGNILVAYNIVQVMISCYIFYLGFRAMFQYGLWNKKCLCQEEDIKIQILDGNHLYFMAKVIELLDTVFFVFRKKQRQVSFLHVYHHTLMVIATWSIAKYNEADSPIFLGTINSLVHIVMYSYYGLSVFPALTKYLWWKKYITIMQLVQFCLMFLHIIVSHVVSECKPAYILLFSVTSNTILFMYLFGDFYMKSYTRTNMGRSTEDLKKEPAVSLNGEKKRLNYIINHHKLAGNIN